MTNKVGLIWLVPKITEAYKPHQNYKVKKLQFIIKNAINKVTMRLNNQIDFGSSEEYQYCHVNIARI